MWEFLELILDSPWTVWATCVINYAINYVSVCMRSEMAIDIGFKKWNQCLMSGLPTDSSLLCFGTVKNSPGLYDLDQKRSCVVCMKLFELNGLCCVEINRLMHELNVSTRSHNYIKHNYVCRPLEMEL